MNITQLKQGSLNGLRRQVNECLDNAYNKGYQDGKSDPQKIEPSVNAEIIHDNYMKGQAEGYARGKEDGYKEGYDKGLEDGKNQLSDTHIRTLEAFEELYIYQNNYKDFFKIYDTEIHHGYNLFDLVAKYGAKKVVLDFMTWKEEKKQAEEIKVGDLVYYGSEMMKAIVLDIADEQGVEYAIMYDENGLNVNEELSQLKFIKHTNVADKLQELFSEVEE